ncbi:MAG: hypothetical protein L0Y67_01390 [Gammaproteobacteria bacterium]|nr:hypothetical protein [Gammaproteobacteria bacterium]MCI0590256.1 hypothetical protein [Gammaproteobacteria bacterium]
MIRVHQTWNGEPMEFNVTVKEANGQTQHHVTITQSTYRALTGARVRPEQCVEAAFKFLLEHEPKESILSRFDISVISTYFPRFEREFPKYL